MKAHSSRHLTASETSITLPRFLPVLAGLLLGATAPAAPRPPAPPVPETGLLYREHFDEPYHLASGQGIDPSVWAESWSGYALNRSSQHPVVTPWVVPMLATDGHWNMDAQEGALRFWYQPDSGLGTGNPATLLTLVSSAPGTAPAVWWSLVVSGDGQSILLTCEGASGPSTCLIAPVALQSGTWYLLTLLYEETSSALLINTQQVAVGSGLPTVPAALGSSTSLVLGSDWSGSSSVACGQLDEFTAFTSEPRVPGGPVFDTGRSVTGHYAAYSALAVLGPLSDEELAAEQQALGAMPRPMQSQGPASPMGTGGVPRPLGLTGYPSNVLWLSISQPANGLLPVTIFNAQPGIAYELLSRVDLPDAGWTSEGMVTGAPDQDWTATAVVVGNRTNSLFLQCRSWISSNGAIPDWWMLQFFGRTDIDPYTYSPSGDGWTLLDCYENGGDPRVFYPPPTPRGLTVNYNGVGTPVAVSWQASHGLVTSYSLERYVPSLYSDEEITNITQTSYVDSFQFPPPSPTGLNPSYRVQAHYGLYGDSEWSDPVPLFQIATAVNATVVRGPQGRPCVVVSSLPPQVATVRVAAGMRSGVTNLDVPVGSFTNGVALLPELPNPAGGVSYIDWWYFQTLDTNGLPSTASYADGGYDFTPFFDGRSQLTNNLIFLLRGARGKAFHYFGLGWDGKYYDVGSPSDYVYADFYRSSEEGPGPYYLASLSEFQPFDENYFYRNFVFAATDVDANGFLTTGVDYLYSPALGALGPIVASPLLYSLTAPAEVGPIPDLLSGGQSEWTYGWPLVSSDVTLGLDYVGIRGNYQNGFSMDTGVTNWFGLPYVSAKFAYASGGDVQFDTLYAGGNIPGHTGYFYAATAPPLLYTSDYYFCRPDGDPSGLNGSDLFPGHADFSPTNTTPLLTASVGVPFRLAGYAKQEILNGDRNKWAYLGQYFDSAWMLDASGALTTNQAGVLSPYGEFFPMQPGVAGLITLTNRGGTERGTGVVQVIALCADASHDGVINPAFFGPDSTSPYRPFRFWVNDNNDTDEDAGDGIPGQGSSANGQDNHVNSTRDLVNFFPISLEIRSLLQAYPPSTFTCWLKNSDGALNYVDPDYIELPIYPTNCLAYMTDTNLAHAIAPAAQPPGAPTYNITPDGEMLSQTFVEGIRQGSGNVLLVEARSPTASPLVLEVRQGTNLVAQASLYLSITGVEQMFRHKNLIAETFPNTNSLGGPSDRLADSDVPNEPETNGKNFVFIHGYNVNPKQARGWFADTFKRLYWSGSHARFYGVSFRGSESQVFVNSKLFLTPNYHTNVVNALLTAPHLASFLGTLTNGPTTLAAHSLGNMVVLAALNDRVVTNVSAFFMIDAAVAMEALDGPNAAVSTNMIHPDWNYYVRRLYASEWFGLFASNDARNGLTWSNRLANIPITNIYNFYSTGEEVLREDPNGAPPALLLSAIPQQVVSFLQGAEGQYAWAWQEKDKGRCPGNGFVGSNHGGWGFNPAYDTNFWYQDGYVTNHMDSDAAASLAPDQLRTNAFFNTNTPDTALFTTASSGSDHAQANRDRILADAIPALTLPIGANPVTRLEALARNVNMQDLQNNWPADRMLTRERNNWHHSDFRQVGYTFTYKLFDEFVNFGNLR